MTQPDPTEQYVTHGTVDGEMVRGLRVGPDDRYRWEFALRAQLAEMMVDLLEALPYETMETVHLRLSVRVNDHPLPPEEH